MNFSLVHDIGSVAGGRGPARLVTGAVLHALGMLSTWRWRAETRARLLALDEHLLRDIGISRADAVREGGKPFWAE